MSFQKTEINLNLAILDIIRPPEFRMNLNQIAEISGFTYQRIQQIEADALRKLAVKIKGNKHVDFRILLKD